MLGRFVTHSLPIIFFFFFGRPRGRGHSPSALSTRVKRTSARAHSLTHMHTHTHLNPLNNHGTSRFRFIVYYSLRFPAPLFVPSSRGPPSSPGNFMEPLKSTTIRIEGVGWPRCSIYTLSISCILAEKVRRVRVDDVFSGSSTFIVADAYGPS